MSDSGLRNMDQILEELDEAKANIERLREECKTKGELSENLKRANNEQVVKLQDLNLRIEKQAQELNEKEEELSMEKKSGEELAGSLSEKESVIKHLTSSYDKLRADTNEKFLNMEEEKRSVVMALDNMNEKCMHQEQRIFAYEGEIEGLKKSVSFLQRKCSEAEERSRAQKELIERDDVLMELNNENTKVRDELKWKTEQFQHLEQALEKVRDQFKVNKKEWELEKSTLLDEICSLQTSFESQMLLSKDLHYKLEMCNQALAHEESRRKLLQVQVNDYQTRFENVDECERAKLLLDEMTAQRDEEIAALRCLLGTKDSCLKETEYQAGKLEQENQELRTAIKELHEAQIREVGTSSSFTKMQNKLKSSETAQVELSANFQAKEVEWKSQLEETLGDLNGCKSELFRREATKKDLEEISEGHYNSAMQLKLQNEELSTILLVLNQGISESQAMLAKDMAEVDMREKDREEKISLLTKQLAVQNVALVKAHNDIEEERGKVASLMKRVESLNLVEEQQTEHNTIEKLEDVCDLNKPNDELAENKDSMQGQSLIEEQYKLKLKELDQYRETLEESFRDHLQLKEQVLEIEREARERLREACSALEEANAELADKICEGNQIDFEMHMWKSIAERLKVDLEEIHDMRRELEASLLAEIHMGEIFKQEKYILSEILKEKDERIESLEQQVTLLEQGLEIIELETTSLTRTHAANSFNAARNEFLQTIIEKDEIVERLQNEVECLEQDSLRRELEVAVLSHLGAERMFQCEKEKLIEMVEKKTMRIDQLMQLVESLEQKFNSSLISFSAQLDEKQAEMSLVHQACEKINAAEILAVLETEEKKLMILELEDNIRVIQQKLESQEISLGHAKEKAMKIESDLEEKESEMKKLTHQMKTKLTCSDALINEIKSEKSHLIEDVLKLSSEKEDLMAIIEGIGNHINKFSNSDKELMGLLEKIMLSFDNECERMETKCNEELLSFSKENVISPTATKVLEVTAETRSPFRELNS